MAQNKLNDWCGEQVCLCGSLCCQPVCPFLYILMLETDLLVLLFVHCRELGLITIKTRWKEYAPVVKTEEAYLAVSANCLRVWKVLMCVGICLACWLYL
jgi:hypothetical protein